MKKHFYHFLYACQAPRIADAMRKSPVGVILAYHKVYPAADENNFLKEMIVTPEAFEKQILFLKDRFKIVSLMHFIEQMKKGRFDENVAVLTFDDGTADNYTYAYSILKKHQLPATIFIPTAFIESDRSFYWDQVALILKTTKLKVVTLVYDGLNFCFDVTTSSEKQQVFRELLRVLKRFNDDKRKDFLQQIAKGFEVKINRPTTMFLNWQQMKEMKRENISFGAHTHTHVAAKELDEKELKKELLSSKKCLDQQLDQDTKFFAYPFGTKNDFSSRLSNIMQHCGFECALTMNQGLVSAQDDLFQLKRVGVGGYDSKQIFALKVSGVIPALNQLKGLFS